VAGPAILVAVDFGEWRAMNGRRQCDKVLLVQAELDGELDAAQAATLAVHRAECPICQAAAADIALARGAMHADLYEPMLADMRARIVGGLGLSPTPIAENHRWVWLRSWWGAGAGFGLGAACAAALAFLILIPAEPGITDQIVSGHIRAFQPGHLEDVESSDRHTVKPWFDGRIDFAPPVKDLAAERFPLTGGRLDYLAGRPVAALVYQRDKHIIDLFVWPASDTAFRTPETAQRHGYNLVHWAQDGMNLWAVSDLEMNQLREFAQDWQRKP
jgi:anti-sigma factor RsiW